MMTPAATARAMASFSIAVEHSGQSVAPHAMPSERLITRAPCVAAQSIAVATSDEAHSESSVQARMARIEAPGASPAPPVPLPVHCAMTPATKVP